MIRQHQSTVHQSSNTWNLICDDFVISHRSLVWDMHILLSKTFCRVFSVYKVSNYSLFLELIGHITSNSQLKRSVIYCVECHKFFPDLIATRSFENQKWRDQRDKIVWVEKPLMNRFFFFNFSILICCLQENKSFKVIVSEKMCSLSDVVIDLLLVHLDSQDSLDLYGLFMPWMMLGLLQCFAI